MSHPINPAITLLEAEVDKLGVPKEGTSAWFVLRGKSTGLSLLKAMRAQGFHEDLESAEAFRKDVRMQLVAEVAPAVVPTPEVIPTPEVTLTPVPAEGVK